MFRYQLRAEIRWLESCLSDMERWGIGSFGFAAHLRERLESVRGELARVGGP